MRNNLTKKDIVKSVYMQIGFPKKVIDEIINDLIELIISGIKRDKKLKISNFGTFTLREKKSRIGRNPKTKEERIIVERKVLLFKPAKEFKKFVNTNNDSKRR
tara:strand:- start:544 stop:852 length:309 start_codon:yes stop_codon:yes gene_type:complete